MGEQQQKRRSEIMLMLLCAYDVRTSIYSSVVCSTDASLRLQEK